MNKILIINPFGIGDVLFTTPVIANLRQQNPKARIAYLGNRRTCGVLEANPKIDKVFVYERDEFYEVYRRSPLQFARKWLDFVSQIRQERFDTAFDFSLNRTFGFLSVLAGIGVRVGYDFRGRGGFLTHKRALVRYEGRHVVEYYLDLLKDFGIPTPHTRLEMPVASSDGEWATQWLKTHGLLGSPLLLAVIPGGGASWGKAAGAKRWPASKYADLVDKVVAQHKAAVILFGDATEEALCQEITRLAHHPLYSAVGQTSLTQMAALLKYCRLAVANDGGPLHVAVASGIPAVGIFGPVDDVVYGPYPAAEHTVVKRGLACQPCYRNFRMTDCRHLSCLRDLSVQAVFNTIERKVQSKL